MTAEDIFQEFNEENNLIKEYDCWKLLVSNRSKTLGNCVLITKQHHERFSELSNEEILDFNKIVKEIENSLKKAFDYDKINWLMLMMKDNHTHFHIIPRYKKPRNFAGLEFVDTRFEEGNPLLNPRLNLQQEMLNKIKEEIRHHLHPKN